MSEVNEYRSEREIGRICGKVDLILKNIEDLKAENTEQHKEIKKDISVICDSQVNQRTEMAEHKEKASHHEKHIWALWGTLGITIICIITAFIEHIFKR